MVLVFLAGFVVDVRHRLLGLLDPDNVPHTEICPLYLRVDLPAPPELYHVADAAGDVEQRRVVVPETGVDLANLSDDVLTRL